MIESKTKSLLLAILAETQRVESLPRHRYSIHDPREWVARCTAIDDWKAGYGVRVRGDWIGESPADRQARKRGLAALEREGLVTLHAVWDSAKTHVRLTDEGRAWGEAYQAVQTRMLGHNVSETNPTAATTG